MKICFYSDRMQFDGDWLEKRGLGGSESALINLTTIWKQKYPKDEITIYNGNREKQIFNDVTYKSINDFRIECKNFNQDVFVSFRETTPLKESYIGAKKIIFFSEDDSNEITIQEIKNNLYIQNRIDLLLAVSEYAKNDIKKFGITTPIEILRNGYRQDWIDKNDCKEEHICVYTSTPFRGLTVLSEVWPEIYKKCNEKDIKPKLEIYTGMGLYNQFDNPFLELYKKLKSQPNVEVFPPICQRELYKKLGRSSVMLYPNFYTETSCMSVLESLANDVWVVTTDLGALGEQVKDGFNGYLISGDSRSKEYQEEFIEKSVEAICNPIKRTSAGLIFTWDEQVDKFRRMIEERIY